MKNQLVLAIDKAILAGILLVTFSLPIFFLPVTFESFEFPKTIFLFLATLILLLLWALKSFIDGKITILKTPVNLPLLLFFAIYFLATILSSDRNVSFFGFHPRFYGSLLQIFSLTAIFFVCISNLKKQKINLILWSFLSSSTIVSILVTLSYFNLLPVQNFTTLANFGNTAIFLSLILPIGLFFLLQNQKVTNLLILGFIILVHLFSLILINFPPAWIVAGVLVIFFLFYIQPFKLPKTQKLTLVILAALFISLLILAFVPILQKNILLPISKRAATQAFLPTEPELPQFAGWVVAARNLGTRPILGTGPSTFAYAFTSAKPIWLNNTPLWNLRFLKSSNEIFRIFTETGLFGGLVFLFFLYSLLKLIIGKLLEIQLDPESFFVILVNIGVLTSLFLFAPSLVHIYLVFIFAALLMIAAQDEKRIYPTRLTLLVIPIGKFLPLPYKFWTYQKLEPLSAIFLLLAISALVFGGLISFQQLRAEVFYKKALTAIDKNQVQEAQNLLQKAINVNPYRDSYHRTQSSFHLALAQNLSQKQNLEEAEKQSLQSLINSALNLARLTTGYNIIPVAGTQPLNVSNWENLGTVYFFLIGATSGAENHAIAAFNQAIRLDSANVILWENLGKVYHKAGNFDQAAKALEVAIGSKPDYPAAHYSLAQVLKQKGGLEARVVQELSQTLRFLPQESLDRNQIQKELAEAQIKVQETQRQQLQPVPQPATPAARPR